MTDRPKTAPPLAGAAAARFIGDRAEALGDRRGEMLRRVQAIIHKADPEIIEEVKWGRTPTWSKAGIVTTCETYKDVVKMTFARGAALPDPAGLFNASLDAGTRRAIDIRQGETPDEAALIALIREAVALNVSAKAGKKSRPPRRRGLSPATAAD